MNNLRHFWNGVKRIGVDATMSYLELRRVQMVNLIALICLPFTVLFSCTNFLEHRYLLASINIFNAVFLVAIIMLQVYRMHSIARVILLASSFVCYFLGGLLFKNGGEYFLLCILIASMLLYDKRWVQVFAGTFVIAGVIIIQKHADVGFIENTVPISRSLYNIASSLVFIVVSITSFKDVILDNTRKIDEQRIKLETMNRDKERIFSIIAHDMRSPLATLESMVVVLRERMFTGEVSDEFMLQLQRRIAQQNRALEGLLQWSSSSMEGIHRVQVPVNIRVLVMDVIQAFEVQYIHKSLSFEVEIREDLLVLADGLHLTIIFRNLISNAIKFSYVGGTVKVYTSEEVGQTHIHFRDYGIGMHESKSMLLFDTIQQRSTGTVDEPGAGVGLVLCKELIRLNEGHIHIHSVPDEGSVFTIGFPMFISN